MTPKNKIILYDPSQLPATKDRHRKKRSCSILFFQLVVNLLILIKSNRLIRAITPARGVRIKSSKFVYMDVLKSLRRTQN